ncbi:hypothetical protein PG991_005649 [Apiospora marii]|uniref:EamA domain-containing protein n=1 Tax=Apiospora marii TaxID=335849 RepID=A0ABR1S9Y8_9PEZI
MAPRKKPAARQQPLMHPDEPKSDLLPPSTSVSAATTTARRRQGAAVSTNQKMSNDAGGAAAARPSTESVRDPPTTTAGPASWASRNQWIVLAIASGACAAFNGVFAKLTTNNFTTQIAQAVSGVLGLSDLEQPIEYIVRAAFFGLNLVFNGVMWTLFTKALARGSSTTQVSIMNTSANFVITAVLGFAIFAESLPPLWWLGAAMLVAGNVIIGRKDEGTGDDAGTASASEESSSEQPLLGQEQQPRYDDGVENVVAAGIAAGGVAAIGAAAQVDETMPRVEKDEDDEEDVAMIGDLESEEL